MSKTITFIQPDGLDIENPSPDFVREVIYNEGNAYWQSNAGDAAFWFDENDERKADLIVVGKDPEGFRLEYQSYADDGDYVLTNEAPSNEEVTVYVGGNRTNYWKNQFVSKETAWKAIEHFTQTGERLQGLNWQKDGAPSAEYAEAEMQAA